MPPPELEPLFAYQPSVLPLCKPPEPAAKTKPDAKQPVLLQPEVLTAMSTGRAQV